MKYNVHSASCKKASAFTDQVQTSRNKQRQLMKKIYMSTVGEAANQINSVWTLRLNVNSVPDSSTAQFINFFVQFSKQFQRSLEQVWTFQQEKMSNKTKRKPWYVEPDTSKSITPTKAFWQSRKSEKFGICKACTPYIAIDKIFGELTCRICGHQTYREKAMKKHIEVCNNYSKSA